MKKIYILLFTLVTQQSFAQTVTENFDNVFSLYTSGGWFSINNSNPNNTSIWYQDGGNFAAHSGAANSCISAGWYCTDTVGTGDASVWLFTPPMMLHNGDTLSFYTISYNNADYADRLEVRLNTTNTDTSVGTTATSVGNYTDLQLTINPALNNTSYPMTWTKYEIVLSTIPGGMKMARIGFRYNVPNTGGSGTNGSVVGIDDFRLKHTTIGISENSSAVFNVYPNPVRNTFFINGNHTIKSVVVKDLQGKTCKTVNNINGSQVQINLDELQAGVYMAEIHTAGGVIAEKLVKE